MTDPLAARVRELEQQLAWHKEEQRLNDVALDKWEAENAALQQRLAEVERERDKYLLDLTAYKLALELETQAKDALQREVQELKRIIGLDCADTSCRYAVTRTGMRTNGGCRCDPDARERETQRLREALEEVAKWDKRSTSQTMQSFAREALAGRTGEEST